MIRLSANLSMLFDEHAFLDRFRAAADAGFGFVECQFPHEDAPASAVATAARAAGVGVVSINADAGDRSAGELGLALGDEGRFRASIEAAAAYALEVGCPRVHVLAGLTPDGWSMEAVEQRLADRYDWAADRLGRHGLTLLVEALNAQDRPGYGLTDFDRAARTVAGLPNAALLFDAYHAAKNGLDPLAWLAPRLDCVGHVQVASAADRGEPLAADRVDELFALLEGGGYAGFVGCEYAPRAGTVEGLGWAAPWLRARG